MSLGEPPRPIVPENATPIRSTEMGRNIIGYEIPLEKPADYPETDAKGFPVPPLVAKYDERGKLLKIESQQRYFADNEYHIQPQYSATGEFITDSASTNAANSGSLFGDIKRDLGPIILAALAGNAAAGNLSGLLGGAAPGAAASTAGAGAAAGGAGVPGGLFGSTLPAGAGAGGFFAPGVTAGAATLGIPTMTGAPAGVTAGIPSGAAAPAAPAASSAAPAAAGGASTGGAAAGGAAKTLAENFPGGIDGVPTTIDGLLDFAKKNPSLIGGAIGAITGAIDASNAPKSTTATTAIDPELKREYLANIERAKEAAAGLGVRQFAEPNQMYTDAEKRLYNLGMTPFGAEDISKFYNPYQEQVVQGALGDIERTRQIQEQANMEQATRARAFGGSRQGVVSGMTNEAALRQAATTGANLRATGFNTAADLGFRARTTDTSGLRTSMDLGTARTALDQAKLDAERNLALERLGITSGSLGIGIPNLGGSTSQPLYSSAAGSALSGGLTGGYIGSLLGERPSPKPYKPGDFIMGP